jgi:hypothetical protein
MLVRQRNAGIARTALILGVVVVVAVWLGRGVLMRWLMTLHGVH